MIQTVYAGEQYLKKYQLMVINGEIINLTLKKSLKQCYDEDSSKGSKMKWNKSKDNKPIYSGLSTLEIRKTVMCKFWFDYVKPMYQDKGNLSYIDTDIFVANIKTNDVYKDITNAFKKRCEISNYVVERQLPIGKSKKKWSN